MRIEGLILALLPLSGCAPVGVRLSPEVAGCYRVEVDGWTSAHAAVTGFRVLPSRIALDTAHLGRVLVPASWSFADPPNVNSADLSLFTLPWQWEGDTMVFDTYARPHALANDSVIVSFQGWGGRMVAFLAHDDRGFSGHGFFAPLPLAATVPSLRVRLRGSDCPPDLR